MCGTNRRVYIMSRVKLLEICPFQLLLLAEIIWYKLLKNVLILLSFYGTKNLNDLITVLNGTTVWSHRNTSDLFSFGLKPPTARITVWKY